MKRLILLSVLCLFFYPAYNQILTVDNGILNELSVIASTGETLEVALTLGSIQGKEHPGPTGPFTSLYIADYSQVGSIGHPGIPVLAKLIELPHGAEMSVEVLTARYKDYSLEALGFHQLMPVQPPLIKSATELPVFQYDTLAYQQNDFSPKERVTLEDLGYLRSTRLGRLSIQPLQYNPFSRVLRVYYELRLVVRFHAPDTELQSSRERNTRSPYFGRLKSLIFNSLPAESPLDTLVQYPVKYVIVSPPSFQTALQPLVAWKKKKGFTVIEAYTDNPMVGTTTTSIKAYLEGLYNAGTPADPAPSFVLIAGDVAQIPAFTGTSGSHPTDLYYGEYSGDVLPEVYYGRFSATNETQLQAQIVKTLEYEQYTMPDPSFLDHCVMVAGMDANFGNTHANGQINYGTSTYFNPAHGLTSHTYLYPASGTQGAQIIQDVSNGCSFANYTAHGSSSGWASPSFTTANIPSLTNAHKYPLMVGNACVTNKFNEPECFGEALLRASNKGAIGYIGASNNTYWNEDYYWAVGAKAITVNPVYSATALGAYDRTFHDHGEPYSEWFMTQAQMMYAGNLAVTQGAASSSTYYWEIYHLMGDPSLMIYFSQPDPLLVTYPSPLPLSASTFTANTEPYAYIAVSVNGNLHGAGQANAAGIATFPLIPLAAPGIADVLGSKQNRQPFSGTLPVANPNAPLCLFQGVTIQDPGGNNNQLADYGETILLNITVHNAGLQPAQNVTVQLSTSDPYVSIPDGSEYYGNIPAGGSLSLPNAFSCQLAWNIPDGHQVPFLLSMSDGSNTWTSTFTLAAHAPVLAYNTFQVLDPAGNQNNKLDPGETATLQVVIQNSGSATALNVNALLSTTSPYLSLVNPTQNYGTLNPAATSQQSFTLSADPLTPAGSTATFSLLITADNGISGSATFTLTIGQVPVLIINLDGNDNAATALQNAVLANNLSCTVENTIPPNLSLYASVFMCLGIYSDNHVLTNTEAQPFTGYLNNGGRLYLEGGDTWFYDPQTTLHPFFHLTSTSDGSADLSIVEGISGTMTEGMMFVYTGDNNWIDRLGAGQDPGSALILRNTSPQYGTAVSYQGTNYKTIAASHEFAGLADATLPSTRAELMKKYLEFFDILAPNANQATISLGSFEGCSDMFSIPIQVTNLNNVASISLTITYDASALVYQNFINLNPAFDNGSFLVNQSGNNLILSWVSLAPVSLAAGTLLELVFFPTQIGTFPLNWNTLVPGSCQVTNILGLDIPITYTGGQATITGNTAVVSVSIEANPAGPICEGSLVNFTASGLNTGLQPQWTWKKNGITVGNSQDYSDNQLVDNDVIQCELLSSAGCVTGNPATSNMITMLVHPVPMPELGNDTVIVAGQPLVLDAGAGNETYLWSTGEITQSITVGNSGTYSVTVTNVQGCSGSDTISIIVILYDSFTGSLHYANTAQTPLGNTAISLQSGGSIVAQTLTLPDGSFQFTGVLPGNYKLLPACTKPWGGVNATDALLIMKHFVGLSSLSGIHLAAGDPDGTGVVNSVDALATQKRSVGMLSSFPAGDWALQKPSFLFNGQDLLDFPLQACCYGDVNGSYLPPSLLPALPEVKLSGHSYYQAGDLIEIPLSLEEEVHLAALTLFLELDPSIGRGMSVTSPVLQKNLVYTITDNILKISWYGLSGLAFDPGDVILNLQVLASSEAPPAASSYLRLLPQTEFADPQAKILDIPGLHVPALRLKQDGISAGFYPNPFSGGVRYYFDLPEAGNYSFTIYNAIGQVVYAQEECRMEKGRAEGYWPGRGNDGLPLQPGIFVFKVEGEGKVFTVKMTKTH